MRFIDQETIAKHYDFPTLIRYLREAFGNTDIEVPMRHHHDFPNPPHAEKSTLLLMPAWEPGKNLGVKLATVAPHNSDYGLPSIQGLYILMDGNTGCCKMLFDAKPLTTYRTAATSALASSYLSREDSEHLFMVGTGALSPMLIRAHCSVRPIKKVTVWGRSSKKSQAVIEQLKDLSLEFAVTDSIQAGIKQADIISCATLSKTALIQGAWLQSGQHLDLVGAYRPDMREADDECLLRSQIFVDHYAGACKETGDIAIPLQTGVIQKESIKSELFELCQRENTAHKCLARESESEITLFKSVGHALEDLVAAKLIASQLPE